MAVEIFDPSVAGYERAGAGAYPMPLVRATTAGFIGKTERGPLNEPVAIGSFAEYDHFFGGHIDDSFLSHAVQDFFAHGGSAAAVVRVANRATRAEIHCPAGDETLIFTARYPGSQEVLRVSIDYDGVDGERSLFNLVVQRLRRGVSTVIADQELFPRISVDAADERYVVDVLRDSRLIAIGGAIPSARPDATLPSFPGQPIKYIGMSRPGADGAALTDYDLIGSRPQGTGLFAFGRGPKIDILCIPPPPARDLGPTVFVAAERICAERKSLFVFDPPWSWDSPARAIAGARTLESGSRHVLAYYPRIRPRGDRARSGRGFPACGAVAGMLAHRDARGLWQGGGDLLLKTSLTAVEDIGAAEGALLARSGVNVFRRGQAGQTLLAGNRTLGGARLLGPRASTLDRCRLLDFVLTSVEDAVAFALEHFYGGTTLAALERQLGQFLLGLHERGALAGDAPAQAFYVRAMPPMGATMPAMLRLGIALDRAGEFVDAEVPVEHGRPPIVVLTAGLEAERLLF